MLKFNLKGARHFHWPRTTPPAELSEIAEFFVGGQSIIDLDSASVRQVGEDLQITELPGRMHLINMSKKFCDARNELRVLYSSSKLPTQVANALREIDADLETDVKLIATAINESFALNQRNIREHDDPSSDRQHRTWNLYWSKFISLKPKADETGNAIRAYLELEKNQAAKDTR